MKVRAFFWLWTALLGMLLLPRSGMAQSLQAALQYLDVAHYQPEIYLPYQAAPERVAALQKNMNSLQQGASPAEVLELLGPPDEVEAIMAAGERDEEFQGFLYRYVLDRRKSQEWGKTYDERQITLQFNLLGQLVSALSFGVPEFKEIVRVQGLDLEFSLGLHETVRINELFLRLDFVLDALNGVSAESALSNEEQGAFALLTAALEDREDDIKLKVATERQNTSSSIHYGTYKITLMAIPSPYSIRLLVE